MTLDLNLNLILSPRTKHVPTSSSCFRSHDTHPSTRYSSTQVPEYLSIRFRFSVLYTPPFSLSTDATKSPLGFESRRFWHLHEGTRYHVLCYAGMRHLLIHRIVAGHCGSHILSVPLPTPTGMGMGMAD